MQRIEGVSPVDFKKHEYSKFVLAADIGGTNARFSVAAVNNAFTLIITHLHETQHLSNVWEPMNSLLKEAKELYNIEVNNACIAVAGPVNAMHSHGKLTHGNIVVDSGQIYANSLLGKVAVINDFEAIGYSVNNISPEEDTHTIYDAYQKPGRILILGPGTGLGVSIVHKHETKDRWQPMPSEGGHLEIQACNEREQRTIEYCKQGTNAQFEDLVSGPGLVRLHKFMISEAKKLPGQPAMRTYEEIPENFRSSAILGARDDLLAREAVNLFLTFYGRAAKNIALTVLPTQLYLAGGFSRSLVNILNDKNNNFVKEFQNNSMRDLLMDIRISILQTHHAGLIGASEVAAHWPEIGVGR
ncbi:MAG: glucokinase [Candidatus Woesearchaeota archaeon]